MDVNSGSTDSNGAPEFAAEAAAAAAVTEAPTRQRTRPRRAAASAPAELANPSELGVQPLPRPRPAALLPVGLACPIYSWSPVAPGWGATLVLTSSSPANPFLPTSQVLLLYGPDPTHPTAVDNLTANTVFSGNGQTATVKLPAAASSPALPYFLRVDASPQQACGPLPISIGGSVIPQVDLDAVARNIVITVNSRAATPTVGEFANGVPATPYPLTNFGGMPDTIEVALELANAALLPAGFGLVAPDGTPIPAMNWLSVAQAIRVEDLWSWINAVEPHGDGPGSREKALQAAGLIASRVSAQLFNAVAAARTTLPRRGLLGTPGQPAVPVTVNLDWMVTSDRDVFFNSQEQSIFGSPDVHAAAFADALLHLRALHFVEDRQLDASDLATLIGHMKITVEFSLSLGTQTVGPYSVSLPVVVPPLPLPTVAVFFSNPWPDSPFSADAVQELLGRMFVMLPGNSAPGNVNDLALKLATVAGALNQLGSLVSLATFLAGVSDLGTVLRGVTDVGYIQFRVTDRINDLEDVVFVPKGIFWDFDTDVDADDRFNSLLFVGVPGTTRHTIKVYNDSDCSNQGGEFHVDLIDFAVRVPRFGEIQSGSEPPGVTVIRDASVDWIWEFATFSAAASSLRYGIS